MRVSLVDEPEASMHPSLVIRNRRKRREWTVFNALNHGEVPEGVTEIVAPEGVHVVDHVTHAWLPRAPRPFAVDDPDHAKLHLRA